MKKPPKLKPLSERALNIIRGKNIVGLATKEDIFSLFMHLDYMEQELDELDNDDALGTEGWRHRFRLPDAD